MKAEEIKKFRQKLDMTQAQFAEKVGVDRVTVARWEAGKFRPSRLAVEKIQGLKRAA